MTQTIRVQCSCGARLTAPASLAGKRRTCPQCGRRVLIAYQHDNSRAQPAPDSDETPAPPPEVPAESMTPLEPQKIVSLIPSGATDIWQARPRLLLAVIVCVAAGVAACIWLIGTRSSVDSANVARSELPKFSKTDLAETCRWVDEKGRELRQAANQGNDFVYKEQKSTVEAALKTCIGNRVSWKQEVDHVTENEVVLTQFWQQGRVKAYHASVFFDFPRGNRGNFGFAHVLIIGKDLDVDLARNLKKGDQLDINATIADVALFENNNPLEG